MAKPQHRRQQSSTMPTLFEQARDELFQHIMQCGVIGCHPDDQKEWFDGTMSYIGERWHELTPAQIAELRQAGERFAAPRKTAGSSAA